MSVEGLTPPEGLTNAVRHLLRPLVRVLISHGVSFPYLAELLKGVYVEVAGRHFRLKKARLTDSRMSILTGVHRKDVKRLRQQPEQDRQVPRGVSLGARVIGEWCGNRYYLNGEQRARPLLRSEFEELVESISKDVRPRTILDEWLRLGYVAFTDSEDGGENRIHLCDEAFVPAEAFNELAYFFGRNLHDHIAAASENILKEGAPHLERALYYPGLSEESVKELEALAREQANQALQLLNRATLARLEMDKGRDDANFRFCFGTYIYHEQKRDDNEHTEVEK